MLPTPSVLYCLGLDPGLAGAVSLVQASPWKSKLPSDDLNPSYHFSVAHCIDLAAYTKEKTSGMYLQGQELMKSLSPMIDLATLGNRVLPIAFEDVGVLTGAEGRVSMFKFGWIKGLLTGLMIGRQGYEPHFHYLKPAVWKGWLGLGRDKMKSLSMAREVFPDDAHYFRLRKHADRAESSLLSYCVLKILIAEGTETQWKKN